MTTEKKTESYTWFQEGEAGRFYIGRFPFEDDLLISMENFAAQHGIKAAWVRVIGALQSAVIGFYDQEAWEYRAITIKGGLEIINCSGNISMREGKPKGHLHITLGDQNGDLKGGHLMEGSRIFAAEFFIQEIKEVNLQRTYDEQTGLPLWERMGGS